MTLNLDDLKVFAVVAHAGGFREASRLSGTSASTLSEAVRRLESELGLRLLNRTTRNVAVTESGSRLLARIGPALDEIASALDAAQSSNGMPAGTLRLNVPTVAAQLVLPALIPPFLAAFPGVRVEVTTDDQPVDLIASNCDAGIRYSQTLERDMVAVPIGPREQRFALAAAPAYLARYGAPDRPDELLKHACLRVRYVNGGPIPWEFRRNRQTMKVEPSGPLVGNLGGGAELLEAAAVAGTGILYWFEDLLRPHFESGALVPLLEPWWLRFPGPFLYYPSRVHLPPPLRAFVDFLRQARR